MDVRVKSLAPTCAMDGASLSSRPDKHMDVRAKSFRPDHFSRKKKSPSQELRRLFFRPLGRAPTLTCRYPPQRAKVF